MTPRRSSATPAERAHLLASVGPHRRTALALAATFIAATFALALTAAPAFAARPYQSQITEANGAAFAQPFGLTVDGSDNLWVSDTGTHSVSKFNSAGVYQTQNTGTGSWGTSGYIESLAFSAKAGEVFVSDSNFDDLWGLKPADATYTKKDLNEGLGGGSFFIKVAADNSAGSTGGDLYVSKKGGTRVVRINANGGPDNFTAGPDAGTNTLTGPFFAPSALAVDSKGDLYVGAESGASQPTVFEFEPSGHLLREFTEFEGSPLASVTAVAVDPTNGNVLIAEPAAIDEFSSTGESLEQLSVANGAPFGNIRGLAVDSTAHLYALDRGKALVDVFGPAGPPPPKFPLEVTITGAGSGKVTSSLGGFTCTSGTCTHEIKQGKLVTLTASPDSASLFAGWTGCESEPSLETCLVQMTAAKSVQAAFASNPPSRNFFTQIIGVPPSAPLRPGPFQRLTDVTVDGAGNLYALETDGNVDKFDPAGAFLSQGPQGEGPHNGYGHSKSFFLTRTAAFGISSNLLYVANGFEGPAAEFFTAIYSLNPEKLTLNSQVAIHLGSYIAVDNSADATDAAIYASTEVRPETERPYFFATRIAADGEPLPFSGSAPYIAANRITGTPAGPFEGTVTDMTVDSGGDFYLTESLLYSSYGRHVVYQYAPSGVFIREFTLAGAPGGVGDVGALAVDPTNGNVLIAAQRHDGAGVIDVFDPAGHYLEQLAGPSGEPFGELGGIAVNSEGYVYLVDSGHQVIDEFTPSAAAIPAISYGPVEKRTHNSGTLTATVKPTAAGEEVTTCHFEYGTDPTYSLGPKPCLNASGEEVGTPIKPIKAETAVHADIAGLTAETPYHYRAVAANSKRARYGLDQEYTPHNVQDLTTDPAEVQSTGATLKGSYTAEAGLETKYFFEYGTSTKYGHKAPVPTAAVPGTAIGTQHLETLIEGLVPHTAYHYRILAENEFGPTVGQDREFTTFQPPTIESFSSSDLTSTSAVLHARIDPQGFPTKYRFTYGPTTAYGQIAPQPDGEITTELSQGHPVEAHLENLQPGVTYHFRILAESKWGTVTSEDQSFEFFPPACPNAAVRQQTSSAYLPDCRAYELVSPGNANGTLLYSAGPTSPYATSPSRFAFTGAFSALPDAEVIGGAGDLYVATRTDTGWLSRYVGPPGSQTGCAGGPPGNPWSHTTHAEKYQDVVPTDLSMGRFLDFDLGSGAVCFLGGNGSGDATLESDIASNAPYLRSSEGSLLARLPDNFQSTPGAAAAFACPVHAQGIEYFQRCTGDVAASGDLNHLFFSSTSLAFAPGGLTASPGSAYDDNLATGQVTLISKLPGGADIPQDSSYAATNPPFCGIGASPECPSKEFIRFPAVSTDGSHVLISTATAGTPFCQKGTAIHIVCPRFTDTPIHLYMRVGGGTGVTYEIAENPTTQEPAPVSFVGMTSDGTKVYFTSEEHLTGEDTEHAGASLYMWSENNGSPTLTLISKAAPGSPAGAGDTASCNPVAVQQYGADGAPEGAAPWTTKCGVVPYSGWSYAAGPAGLGGNGHSDSPIASQSGDVYFYSPEQLDGDRGVAGQQNLYLYRQGALHFVATLSTAKHCVEIPVENTSYCASGPIARFQVTPDGSHAAFLTESRLTSYDNAGHLEMYSYTPATGAIVCDSCNPDGHPATVDVQASQNGLFLTEDGRAFFSTTESLVPRDTNHGTDVYEFVDGRPQLITPGTGVAQNSTAIPESVPGLIGVSANGTDVYFASYDTLTSEDHNGNFLKFYDARTNGGFPQPPPAQPCAAAEECHGPGTEPPNVPTQGTAAILTGGNATPKSHRHSKRHHKKAKHKRHGHRANANRGGTK